MVIHINNINDCHCYIFEFANADQLVTKKELWKDYTFKIVISQVHHYLQIM